MSKRILIVDDEPNIRKLLSVRLKNSKYGVVEAADGKEALEKVKDEKPDLIILDVMMPVMDGYEFLKRLKKNRENSKIPIIMLTARYGMEGLFSALDINAFVPKPFKADKILSTIKSLLKE